MNENEKTKRETVLALAVRYLGCKTGDQTERIIIDAYNSFFAGHYPRGAKLDYGDKWCQPFVEAIAIMTNLADLFPAECGCQEAINLAKPMGIFYDRTHTPKPADVIYFDNNKDGWSDHTGFVKEVQDGKIFTIEGNAMGGTCCEKSYSAADEHICGFVCPKYGDTPEQPDGATDYNADLAGEYAATTGLYIRKRPTGLSLPLGVIPKDGIAVANGWYAVNGSTAWLYLDYNGIVGFSSGKYLSKRS